MGIDVNDTLLIRRMPKDIVDWQSIENYLETLLALPSIVIGKWVCFLFQFLIENFSNRRTNIRLNNWRNDWSVNIGLSFMLIEDVNEVYNTNKFVLLFQHMYIVLIIRI